MVIRPPLSAKLSTLQGRTSLTGLAVAPSQWLVNKLMMDITQLPSSGASINGWMRPMSKRRLLTNSLLIDD
jgi:hypothetical protein